MAYYRGERAYKNIITQDLRPLFRHINSHQRIDNALFARLALAYDLLRTFPTPSLEHENFDQAMHETLQAMRYPGENDPVRPHYDALAQGLLTQWLLDEKGNERRAGAKEIIELLANTPTRQYLSALYNHTAALNLIWNGHPATWAVAFIHADVIAAPGRPPSDPAPNIMGAFEEWLLTIWAPAEQGLVALQTIDSKKESSDTFIESSIVGPDPLKPFAYLNNLEEAAVQQLRKRFAELRARLEAAFTMRNSATLERRPEDLAAIYDHVRRNQPLDHGSKERLRSFMKLLELDFPSQ